MRRLGRCDWALAAACLLAALPAASEGQVAFLAYSDGYWQAWVMRPDGTGLRQVTHSPTEKARLGWYPDGKHLLVLELQGRLVQVDVATGVENPLELGLGGIHDADVSPDGQWLAVSANPGDGIDTHDIWVLRADGQERRRLVAMPRLQHEPRWSQDAAWVYFLSGDGQQDHDIWRVGVASGDREQLTVGARYHFEIDVAPEGAIAFSSNRTGDYEIYVQPPDGKPVRWTDSPGLDGHPSWSPSGDGLIYHSTRGGRVNLWRQDGPDAPAQRLTSFAEGARAPEWGPAAP